MRLDGVRARIDFVQHDCVGFVQRHEYIELQGARLSCQATLGVSFQMLQVFLALAWDGLDGRHDCKFAHLFVPLRP
jgi:hypothetical protein